MSYLVDRKHCKKGNLLYWWFHGKTHCPGYYTCCVIYWIYKFVRIVIYLSCFWSLFIFFFLFNGLCFMFVYISNRKKTKNNSFSQVDLKFPYLMSHHMIRTPKTSQGLTQAIHFFCCFWLYFYNMQSVFAQNAIYFNLQCHHVNSHMWLTQRLFN